MDKKKKNIFHRVYLTKEFLVFQPNIKERNFNNCSCAFFIIYLLNWNKLVPFESYLTNFSRHIVFFLIYAPSEVTHHNAEKFLELSSAVHVVLYHSYIATVIAVVSLKYVQVHFLPGVKIVKLLISCTSVCDFVCHSKFKKIFSCKIIIDKLIQNASWPNSILRKILRWHLRVQVKF